MGLMQQGTDEWLSLRKNYLGGSDAAVVLGVSPFQTRYGLWRDKLGLSPKKESTDRMQRGLDLEPQARHEFFKLTGIYMSPEVKFHETVPFMMASLDGWNNEQKTAVEIKCPGKVDHQKALDGVIPEKYMPQLQHQMTVCDIDSMYYFSFDGNRGKVIKVSRDNEFVDNLISKEKEFWDLVLNFETPELCDKDYIERSDQLWLMEARIYKDLDLELKTLEKMIEKSRTHLIQLAGPSNCMGGGLRLSRVVRKGSIDYKAIPELSNIDLEKYRKAPIESFRIGGMK